MVKADSLAVENNNNNKKKDLKVMPPILLHCSTTSEADVGDMAVEVEPSRQYFFKLCFCVTDGTRGTV